MYLLNAKTSYKKTGSKTVLAIILAKRRKPKH